MFRNPHQESSPDNVPRLTNQPLIGVSDGGWNSSHNASLRFSSYGFKRHQAQIPLVAISEPAGL